MSNPTICVLAAISYIVLVLRRMSAYPFYSL